MTTTGNVTNDLVCPETNEASYMEVPVDEQEVACENFCLECS